MAIALLVPGSASTGDFIRRAFAPVLTDLTPVVVTDPSGDALRIAERIADRVRAARSDGDDVALLVGVSVGAHAGAWWAAGHRPGPAPAQPRARPRLVLAMPAWTGAPTSIAAVTADAAQRLRRTGVARELDRLQTLFGDDWVVAELARAWRAMPLTDLVTSLVGTAASTAPDAATLARIRLPTLVLTLADDPLHPAKVGDQWQSLIPGAALVTVGREEPNADVAVFGRRVLPWLRSQQAVAGRAAAEVAQQPPAEQPGPPAAE